MSESTRIPRKARRCVRHHGSGGQKPGQQDQQPGQGGGQHGGGGQQKPGQQGGQQTQR